MISTKEPKEYLKEPYARILIPDDDSGTFSAEILEFPGCFAQGNTADEAFENLERTALAWIEAVLRQGKEIPPPSMAQGYGGKIALRIPKSIHKRAVELAARDNTSLNQFILSALAARIGAEDFYSRLATRLETRIFVTAGNAAVWAASAFHNWREVWSQERLSVSPLSIPTKTARTVQTEMSLPLQIN